MQLFTATFVKNKCTFLTILLQQKLNPSYEFLVVFGQVRIWDRKSAGRVRTQNFNPRRTLVHTHTKTSHILNFISFVACFVQK